MKTSNTGEVVGLRIFGGKIAPKWDRIFIPDFTRNTGVIDKKVGTAPKHGAKGKVDVEH